MLELDRDQIEVVGRPIPAIESDPISRDERSRNMARFLSELAIDAGVPAIAIGGQPPLVSDPAFSHWVVEQGRIVGEARSLEIGSNGLSFAYVRLFSMPEMAEYGTIATKQLRPKQNGNPA